MSVITTDQYVLNKERLKKAEKEMDKGNKWDNPKYAKWKEEYSRILEENLEYESFHEIT